MARQHVRNRRAGRPSSGTGASWISYSDMMAALLLVFVLILCYSLYHYMSRLEIKENELNEQALQLNLLQEKQDAFAAELDLKQIQLDEKTAELILAQIELNEKGNALIAAQAELENREAELKLATNEVAVQKTELAALKIQLANQQMALDAQAEVLAARQTELTEQTSSLTDLVGVRRSIIRELSDAFSSSSMKAQVDPQTGDIKLDSSVFFKTNSAVIEDAGKRFLDSFIPAYLNVLLQPQYSDYLGEIIIEGHTDSDGTYINNLQLSQNRAMAVAKYVLQMPGLSPSQSYMLQRILTATGRSSSDPIYYSNGAENKDASRRVEFKFSLKDAEMIQQISEMLAGMEN